MWHIWRIWCVFVHALLHMHREENQLDVTECFIALMIRSTCFGHFYAHRQELETECVLLPPMVCRCLVTGCQGSGVEQQGMSPGRGMQHVQHPSSWTHTLLPCTWPPTTSGQALHTIGGSSIHIVIELLMMGIQVTETCCAYHKCNKAHSDI